MNIQQIERNIQRFDLILHSQFDDKTVSAKLQELANAILNSEKSSGRVNYKVTQLSEISWVVKFEDQQIWLDSSTLGDLDSISQKIPIEDQAVKHKVDQLAKDVNESHDIGTLILLKKQLTILQSMIGKESCARELLESSYVRVHHKINEWRGRAIESLQTWDTKGNKKEAVAHLKKAIVFEDEPPKVLELIGLGLTSLPSILSELTYLEEIRASDNKLTDLLNLANLKDLKRLHIDHNQFTALPEVLKNNKLDSLDASHNLITQIAFKLNTDEINLSNNKIKNFTIEPFLEVNYINISNNDFTSLPTNINIHKNLRALRSSGNKLKNLPTTFWSLENLQILDLSDNRLSSLSSEIRFLTHLQFFNVSDNNLTSIPLEIGYLKQLYNLKLNNNNLSSIPSEIGRCSSLMYLDVNDNKNLSQLPDTLGFIATLDRLNIDNTAITPQAKNSILTQARRVYREDGLETQEVNEIPPPP